MKRPPALKVKTERSPPRSSPFLQTPPTPHYPPPRTTTHSAYERSVGFASIAIVVVCGRCVLHRLGSTTYKHPCLNSGRSISGILARPLPKVSFCCLSLAQPTIEGSLPRLSPFPQTPPTPHYPIQRKTGQRFSHRYPVVIIDFCF